MKKAYLLFSFFIAQQQFAQTILSADGTTDTYNLINSVLAPGYDVIESPDNACNENADFGYHIKQELDIELNENVFAFYIFVDENSDRCKNYDRQRNEIKTYDQSPDYLLGIEDETIIYKWKFKLPEGFQYTTKFTHIHQIKPVGGYESMPLYTLTVAGSTGQLRLRYSEVNESQTTLHSESIDDFLGTWVEVTEEIKFSESGTYSIKINKISDGTSLFSFTNSNISNWRPGDVNNNFISNEFVRPKWGIYRSLGSDNPDSEDSIRDQLRDEKLLFNDFSIEKVDTSLSSENFKLINDIRIYPNPAEETLTINNLPKTTQSISLYSLDGKEINTIKYTEDLNTIDLNKIVNGTYILKIIGEEINTSELIIINK